jgi:hypothetical protein
MMAAERQFQPTTKRRSVDGRDDWHRQRFRLDDSASAIVAPLRFTSRVGIASRRKRMAANLSKNAEVLLTCLGFLFRPARNSTRKCVSTELHATFRANQTSGAVELTAQNGKPSKIAASKYRDCYLPRCASATIAFRFAR